MIVEATWFFPTHLSSSLDMKRTRNMTTNKRVSNAVTVALTGISTPATPDQITFHRCTATKKRSIRPSTALTSKRALISEFDKDLNACKTPLLNKPLNCIFERSNSNLSNKTGDTDSWRSLNVGTSELYLALTFPTGQSFRWKQTGPSHYTGVVGTYLFTLRQITDEVEFFIHEPYEPNSYEEAEASLRDYLNLSISLVDMWKTFVTADSRFAALAPYMGGARLLRQDPVECLFQFICSSNNNIQRITQMVGYLSSFGRYLGTVEEIDFHSFPSVEELSLVTEEQLRKAGFGYRAKYIVGAVEALKSKCGGGEKWLLSLRNSQLEEAAQALCTLPGIGPKVAACIALFSLDQHHAIPVDTHVWQIATRYITPELAGERLTPKLSHSVSEAFVKRFGKYAGWAQTVLFIAELSSQQVKLPQHLRSVKETKPKTKDKDCVFKGSEN